MARQGFAVARKFLTTEKPIFWYNDLAPCRSLASVCKRIRCNTMFV